MRSTNLSTSLRRYLLLALVFTSPAAVPAVENQAARRNPTGDYLVRCLVFSISPAPGKHAWPKSPPAVFKDPMPGLPTMGSAGYILRTDLVELRFPSQLASSGKAQQDLEELQRKDPAYRYRLLLWAEEPCRDGAWCMILAGPAL